MKKYLKFLPVAIILLVVFLIFHFVRSESAVKQNQVKAVISGKEFILEVADNPVARGKGLSGRKKMARNVGMLFVFDSRSQYSFWMKGMLIPLDFIWVEEREIKDISENIQPPVDLNSSDLQLVTPRQPINKVIEVNAGVIEELKLKIGDKIEFIPPSPR